MRKMNVGIVTFPISDSGITPLSNLINVMQPLLGQMHLVTGNAGYAFFKGSSVIHTYDVEHKEGTNTFTRIMRYIWTQLKFSPVLMKIGGNVDLFMFFLGDDMIIPILTAKLLRKPVVLSLVGSSVEISRARKDVLLKPMGFLVKTDFILSDKILVYSERLVKEYGLEGHRRKILIASRHFLDFDNFKVKGKLTKRRNIVGYIGRLYEEKGVIEFLKAVPEVLRENGEVEFLIVGEGKLRNAIDNYIEDNNLDHKVRVSRWVPRKEIPLCLNELKLLVLPSYTEGLPNIMLEAMACGTPVLATAVGAIPDIIRDEQTGFLMKENSPQCIAENVIRALDHPNLECIAENARVLVEKDFTYEAAVERYRKVLSSVLRR